MQLNHLTPQTARKTSARIGRGGKRGKTSGRGTKGQKARAGNSMRPELRDIIKKLPKRRGYGKNRARTVVSERVRPEPVSLAALEAAFAPKAVVNPRTIVDAGLIRARRGGMPQIKILATGALQKPLTVSGCALSKAAREKIEAAGGSVE